MIKATAAARDGRSVVLLGLSWNNLDRLRADGLKGFIKVDGKEMGVPVDTLITAGETEQIMVDYMLQFIGSETEVHISDKLKSS
jgi:hypothetical protein